MDCLEAQRLVSERLDREGVDAAQLEAAKDHCRSCPDCSAYVRALVAVQQTPLPEPPEDLADRVMEAVRAEIAIAAAAKTASKSTPTVVTAAEEEPLSLDRFVDRLRDPRNRKAVVTWLAAAAVVFLVAGLGAMVGVRQILNPAPVETARTTAESALPPQTEQFGATQQESADAAGGAAKSAPVGSAPSYITASSLVYVLTGDASGVDEGSLTVVGATSSSLDEGAVSSHEVLGGGDPAVVYVKSSEGALLAFERVERSFGGRTYALTSGALTAFGTWPTLPAGVAAPSNPDGSPEYVKAGTDAVGVTVYRPANADVTVGIAVAPGTESDDPAAGNPGWTWWVPVTR